MAKTLEKNNKIKDAQADHPPHPACLPVACIFLSRLKMEVEILVSSLICPFKRKVAGCGLKKKPVCPINGCFLSFIYGCFLRRQRRGLCPVFRTGCIGGRHGLGTRLRHPKDLKKC